MNNPFTEDEKRLLSYILNNTEADLIDPSVCDEKVELVVESCLEKLSVSSRERVVVREEKIESPAPRRKINGREIHEPSCGCPGCSFTREIWGDGYTLVGGSIL